METRFINYLKNIVKKKYVTDYNETIRLTINLRKSLNTTYLGDLGFATHQGTDKLRGQMKELRSFIT